MKQAHTETGSVALIKLPNAKASCQVNFFDKFNSPNAQNMNELENTAIKVPKKLYISTDPPFFKKNFLFILYPDSKIIGGKSKTTKIPLKY